LHLDIFDQPEKPLFYQGEVFGLHASAKLVIRIANSSIEGIL